MTQPQEQNTNWLSLASVWLGGMVSIPSLLIGSTLISGLTYTSVIIAGFLGTAFVVIFMCLESVAAVDKNVNTIQLARSSFGKIGGPMLIGGIVGLATMGWFGVQTNIAGASFSKILNDAFSIQVSVSLSSILWGIIMLITAVYGIKLMKLLNYIAVPAILILIVFGLKMSLKEISWNTITDFQPSTPMSLLSAIGLAIGFIAVGGVISPDINRFAASRKDAILGSVIGVLPAGLLLLAVGSILSIAHSTHDLTSIFANLGYPILALSILILATWTTNVVNAYSGGLALNQLLFLPESKRPMSTLIAGLIGTGLAAIGILNYFIGFLTILTTTIPPIAGVIIADYWLVKSFNEDQPLTFNWTGIIAWVLGISLMLLVDNPIKNLLSVFISAGVYVIIYKLTQSKQQA